MKVRPLETDFVMRLFDEEWAALFNGEGTPLDDLYLFFVSYEVLVNRPYENLS